MSEVTQSELEAHLSDFRWRFTNLYHIKLDDGSTVLFQPRAEQWEILVEIYEKGNKRHAILKSRQLGFSTLLSLVALDHILFCKGFTAGIVDQTKDDANKKLSMVKFAFDKLPRDLREAYEVETRNDSTLSIRSAGSKDEVSTVYGGKNSRGGTHQLLWISEWGAIQLDDPRRSDDIADGALPSAKNGIIVVETTWKGGKTGRLYTEIIDPSLKVAAEDRTRYDYITHFYGWHGDENSMLEGNYKQISAECVRYFDDLEEKHGLKLFPEQKLWYYKEAWVKKNKRYEEYPSILQEIFLSPVDNAVYADRMDDAMVQGRVIDFNLTREPIYAYWDIGKRDFMTLTFIQRVGLQERIYDHHMMQGATIGDVADYCFKWEREHDHIIIGHYLPHDGGHERIGKFYNKTVADMAIECGLRNVRVVPRIPKISLGIDNVRDRMQDMVFHATNLSRVYEFGNTRLTFLDSMNNYRYAPLTHEGAAREPKHDIYSHSCDSLRTFAEADDKGLVPRSGAIEDIEGRDRGQSEAIMEFDRFM